MSDYMKTKYTQSELRCCPFCSCDAEAVYGQHNFNDIKIRCKGCFVEGPIWDNAEDFGNEDSRVYNEREAIEHWNKRITDD